MARMRSATHAGASLENSAGISEWTSRACFRQPPLDGGAVALRQAEPRQAFVAPGDADKAERGFKDGVAGSGKYNRGFHGNSFPPPDIESGCPVQIRNNIASFAPLCHPKTADRRRGLPAGACWCKDNTGGGHEIRTRKAAVASNPEPFSDRAGALRRSAVGLHVDPARLRFPARRQHQLRLCRRRRTSCCRMRWRCCRVRLPGRRRRKAATRWRRCRRPGSARIFSTPCREPKSKLSRRPKSSRRSRSSMPSPTRRAARSIG